MALSDQIRRLRKAQGISQEKLARIADLSLNLIGRLEGGQVKDPHLGTLIGLADALDTTVSELIGEESAVPLGDAREGEGRGDVVIDLPYSTHEEREMAVKEAFLQGQDMCLDMADVPGAVVSACIQADPSRVVLTFETRESSSKAGGAR